MPTVSVKLKAGKAQTFCIEGKRSLFDELQDAGASLPYGCLAGACSACKVYITNGAENLSPPDAIESNTLNALSEFAVAHPLRLSCRAKLVTKEASIEVF